MKRVFVDRILSDISYADVFEIITQNIDAEKAERKFKRSCTMAITSNATTNLQNAIKFADVTKKTRSTAQILARKIRRITSLLPLLLEYNRNNAISIPIIQLMNEREELSRQQFQMNMKFKSQEYYRINRELTQEDLPMSYQYYNFLIPLISGLSQQC